MLLCRAHFLSSRTERAATAIVVARRQHRRVLRIKQSVRAANTSAGVNSNPSASKPRGMKLKGSCHCGAVSFEVESKTPQPFMHCYCTICRKTQGGGGYTINIMVCVCAHSLVKGTFCMNAQLHRYLVACMLRHQHCKRTEQSLSFLFGTLTGADSQSCVMLQGISETFSAKGTENVSIYRAPMRQHDPKAELAGNMRHFCKVSAWALACNYSPKMQSGLLTALLDRPDSLCVCRHVEAIYGHGRSFDQSRVCKQLF